jgi:hypothetical protein
MGRLMRPKVPTASEAVFRSGSFLAIVLDMFSIRANEDA